MHETKEKIMKLAHTHNLERLGLREICRLIGEKHPQKVKYHMKQLGLLSEEKRPMPKKIDVFKKKAEGSQNIASIPILGLANCGDATMLASAQVDGYLQISKRILNRKKVEELFAVKAVGHSMNESNIDGKSIEDGDYVVVDGEDRLPSNGDYVLSIISGAANIKKFVKDDKNHQIILESESDKYFPPIYLHEDDLLEYLVNGKVLQVIKAPQNDDIRYESFN